MHTSNTIIYSDKYHVDLGNHVFPTQKYNLIKSKLSNNNALIFKKSRKARITELSKVHSLNYIENIKNATLSYADELRLELPYSIELAQASIISCGGTINSSIIALKENVGIHIGGGFHHAFFDHGEGFCVFNDVAVAANCLINKNMRVLIIDCDVHQGNGTASIFQNEPDVFTFSIHQQNNYPLKKEKSDMDVGLSDFVSGTDYNQILKESLKNIKKTFDPDIVFYLAGADVYKEDLLGGLSLSIEDIVKRDKIIHEYVRRNKYPLVITLAGGYAKKIEDTVKIHLNTINEFLNL